MDDKKLVPIQEAAELLGVTMETLRRWDKSGKFPAIRTPGKHRYYKRIQIDLYKNDLYRLAFDWVTSDGNVPAQLPSDFYCKYQPVFQSRLMKMETLLKQNEIDLPWFSLIVAAVGEIGNNSFEHNMGNWPDVLGIFYAYDLQKREIVLADRGRGVLATLKIVKAGLSSHSDALYTAFTEIISGRAPESRGNGLKFVSLIVDENPLKLSFQSGNAKVNLNHGKSIYVQEVDSDFHGCLVVLKY